MIECRITSGFPIVYTFTEQFKIKKSDNHLVIYNIFVICLEQFHKNEILQKLETIRISISRTDLNSI